MSELDGEPGGDLAAALAEWRQLVGAEHVHDDAATRAAAATATFATTQRVPAVVRPGDRAEVQACLRVAQRRRVPMYPVSRGCNWGYGSRVPVRDGCVILDLGRLDRITRFDRELACVTVEPGVTFRQLYQFLEERGGEFYASVTGSAPDTSVLGNAIERGDGAGPYGDRFAHAWELEVVLPTGEVVHTGFGRWHDARAAMAARWGVGPALDGLFSQSNLGVVTRLTIGLLPLPRFAQLGFVSIRAAESLPRLHDALRRLRLDGTLRSPMALWNADKALTLLGQYPWQAARGVTPLPETVRQALRDGHGLGAWNGSLPLYAASAEQARADRAHVEAVLAPIADALVWLGGEVDAARRRELGPLLGVPHERSVAAAYWRKPMAVPSPVAPEADRCGVLWCTPALPARGGEVAAAVQLAEELLPAHGFEPSLALVAIDERLVYLLIAILYDREVPGEDARARACHDALLGRFLARGLYPFRLGLQSMELLPPPDDDWAILMRRLKDALDPHHVLAPGRYEPVTR
jgi:4-cresol dehydrogenase (hydroxylating)